MEHTITTYDERHHEAAGSNWRGCGMSMQVLAHRANLDAESLWYHGELHMEDEKFSRLLLRASVIRESNARIATHDPAGAAADALRGAIRFTMPIHTSATYTRCGATGGDTRNCKPRHLTPCARYGRLCAAQEGEQHGRRIRSAGTDRNPRQNHRGDGTSNRRHTRPDLPDPMSGMEGARTPRRRRVNHDHLTGTADCGKLRFAQTERDRRNASPDENLMDAVASA